MGEVSVLVSITEEKPRKTTTGLALLELVRLKQALNSWAVLTSLLLYVFHYGDSPIRDTKFFTMEIRLLQSNEIKKKHNHFFALAKEIRIDKSVLATTILNHKQ